MPFIGQEPITGAYHVLDAITASATATYNLQLDGGAFSPATANQLLVSLNGVIQKPGSSFTISGSQITFSSALTSSDSIDFIIALGDVLSVGTPTDGSVSAAKMATGAAVANIGTNGIGATQLNLADNYTFTGTIKTPNGMDLLATRTDSSAISYASDTNIIDLTSYQSSYDTFFVDLTFHHTGSTGSSHLYLKGENNSGTNLNLRFVSHGYSQDSSQAIPQVGTGTYFRPTFGIQAGTTASHKFYIHNSRDSDGALSAHLAGNSYWYREGSGASAANFAAYVDNGDKFGYIDVNADQVASGGGETGKIYMRLYGVK